jgi:hypothetical protein
MTLSKWARVAAATVLLAVPAMHPSRAAAADMPCSLVSVAEISDIAGYPMQGPDEASAGAGICAYASMALAHDAVVSYAVVTPERLEQRRRFFAVQTRLCANVAAGTPREGVCKSYARLAQATTLDEYFTARTDDPDATPVPGLGARAIATSQALYVRSGDRVLECVVQRDQAFDPERAQQFAKLLVQRLNN